MGLRVVRTGMTLALVLAAAASASAAGEGAARERAAREAIAGAADVAVRLRADRPTFGLGEVPTLKFDLVALRPEMRLASPAPGDVHLEVNDTRYRSVGLDFRSAVPSPAPEHKDIHVALAENAWQQGADGPRLRLTPGRHTVCVAVEAVVEAERSYIVRAVSNTVEIQILAEPGWGEPAGGIRIRLLAPMAEAGPAHLEIDLKEPVARLEVENVGDRPVRLATQNLTGGRKTAADEWLIGLYVEQWTRDGILRFARTDNADEYWTKVGGSPSVTEIRPGGKAPFGLRLDKLADAHGRRLLDLKGQVLLRPVLEVGASAAGAWSGTARGLFVPVVMGKPAAKAAPRFGIYLVDEPIDVTAPEKVDLGMLRLEEAPVLSDGDIVSYDWDRHTVTLTPEALERLPSPPVRGMPFVVVADGRRCYLGAFWSSISSYLPRFPIIYSDPMTLRTEAFPNRVTLRLLIEGTPDPRGDERVRQALEAAGKLDVPPRGGAQDTHEKGG